MFPEANQTVIFFPSLELSAVLSLPANIPPLYHKFHLRGKKRSWLMQLNENKEFVKRMPGVHAGQRKNIDI